MRRTLPLLIILFAQLASAFEPEEDGMYAVFDTTAGEFTAILAFDAVPLTVGNFVGLVGGTIPHYNETTKQWETKPFYDGLLVHGVVKDQFLITGDPNGDDYTNQDKAHGPGYVFADEMHPDLTHGPYGTLSMWNVARNANGSQFRITTEPLGSNAASANWDGRYAVFGYVVDGTNVLDDINKTPVDADLQPTEEVVINSVTILRVGAEAEAFEIDETFKLPQVEVDSLQVEQTAPTTVSYSTLADSVYSIETSGNLEDWTEKQTLATQAETRTVDLTDMLEQHDAAFFRARRISVPDIAEFKPGTTFTATILGPTSWITWIYKLGEDGKGTASLKDCTGECGGAIDDYAWLDLPSGAQLTIATDNGVRISYYLAFSTPTSGGLYAHVESSSGRTNTAGTFEIAHP